VGNKMSKRLILAVIVALFAFVPVVYAFQGYEGYIGKDHKGAIGKGYEGAIGKSYEGDTGSSGSCVTCHRKHDTVLSQGINAANYITSEQTSEYEYCSTCHGPDAAGADTDVINGVYDNSASTYGTFGKPLNSGGFEKVGGAGGEAMTSAHNVNGAESYLIFGNSTNTSIVLTCTSCHDPDGGSNNYRLLKDTVNGKNVANFVRSNERATSTPAGPHGVLPYKPNYTSTLYKSPSDLAKGITGWCAACHDNYKSTSFDVDPENGRKIYYYMDLEGKKKYRHSVNIAVGQNPGGNTTTVLPLAKTSWRVADNDPANLVVCLTCHAAHGTSATMSDVAQVEPTKSAPSSAPGRSVLLRLDNRGVCQNCHEK